MMMKTFLEEVADSLVKKYGNDLKDLTIVFNNKRPSLYLLQNIAALLGKPFFGPKIQTIEEFFAAASPYVVADNFTQFFALFNAYNEVLTAEGEKTISAEAFYNTSQIILSDFGQIDRDMADALKLFRDMRDIAEIDSQFDNLDEEQKAFLTQFWQTFSPDKTQQQQELFLRLWKRMPLLYQLFHQKLQAKGLSTSARNYREVANGNYPLPPIENTIVFVGFNALSAAEEKVFLQLQKEEKALFYFDTDNYYLNDELQEAGFFMRKNFKAGLINQLPQQQSHFKRSGRKIHVHAVDGAAAQAKLLSQYLPAYYNKLQDKQNASRVAVVLADESLLLPVMQTIPAKYPEDLGYEVPVNITMGYPFASTALYSLTEIWLNLQEQLWNNKKTFYFRDVEQFVNHPYLSFDAEATTTFWKNVLDNQRVEIPVPEVATIAPRHHFFFKRAENTTELVALFRQSMQQVLAELKATNALKKLDAEFFIALLQEANHFENGLIANEVEISTDFAIRLLRKSLSGIAVPFSGEPLRGLQIMGLLESRSLDFDHLFLIAANEGLVPKKSKSTSFIPDSIRRAYKLPVLENQNAISAYLFYRLMQRPETIHIFYNSTVSNASTGEPSRFLRQLEFESSFEFHHQSLAQPVEVVKLREREIKKDREVMKKLEAFLDRGEEKQRKLSASAFNTYLSCTMKFFIRYVACVEEPKEVAEVAEANVIGSVLHRLMEEFYRPMSNEQITSAAIGARRQLLPQLTKRAFALTVLNQEHLEEPIEGYRQIVLAIIEQYAGVILDYDAKSAPFIIHELESWVNFSQPIKVNGRFKKIALTGIIDRVDEINDAVRIVDYKTGGDEMRYRSVPEIFERDSGKSNTALMQTLFYTHVYENASGRKVRPELFVIRKMNTEGTQFYTKDKVKVVMEGPILEREKQLFEELLVKNLEEIFDPEIPFQNTTDTEECLYCPYGKICGRK